MSGTGKHRAGRVGVETLRGNGWLDDAPPPTKIEAKPWEPFSRSALRKCMIMEVPESLRALAPPPRHVTPRSARPITPHAHRRLPEPLVPKRRDPRRDVREMPAYPALAMSPEAQRAYALAQARAMAAAHAKTERAWWEDPIALGSLLVLAPPIGIAAVWSSKRYSNDARWALTVMTALTMCLAAAVTLAVLALRR